MKKNIILGLTIMSLFISGCGKDLSNTPTRQVEIYLNKYQTLDISVLNDLDDIVNDVSFNEQQKEKYREIVKKNYQDLTYKIKNEFIDGDSAIVTVEIEVIDYRNSVSDLTFDSTVFTKDSFDELKLDRLENTKDKVTYTLELTLTKDSEGKWKLNALTNEQIKKIQGMY